MLDARPPVLHLFLGPVDLDHVNRLILVCLAVLLMRKKNPEAPRPFRCPGVPWVPILGAGCCLLLAKSVPGTIYFRVSRAMSMRWTSLVPS